MPDFGTFTHLAPYHILAYGTSLGSQIFQSFIGGIVAFRCLPRPQFSTLQQNIFPVYFTLQTALPAILALTFPGHSSPLGRLDSGYSGVLVEKNRYSVLAPIGTMFVTAVSNLIYFGPATTKIMKERKHQETRDGKKSYDAGPHSKEMIKLNKRFGMMHGMSTMVNLVGLIATMWYAGTLSEL